MHRCAYLLIIPLALSAFTHLWNPIGYPDLFSDEGVYIRRALHILEGFGPQETETYYDNPFFGQLFLAGIFKFLNYPDSFGYSTDLHTIELFFAVPRLLTGGLAVFDTFLVYRISEIRYNRNVALVASVLFAVMPMSWFTRRILLESIQLPFLLSSILCALYLGKLISAQKNKNSTSKNIALVLVSGLLLGASIFTKIPAFVMIPLIGYLIFRNSNRSWRLLRLWIIPVVLIPIIWPIYSLAYDQFGYWWDSVRTQTAREGVPLTSTISFLLQIDPILIILGTSGLVVAILKKDLFLLLWAIPNFIFLVVIAFGWAPYQLFIPIIPLLCIASAKLIFDLTRAIKRKRIKKILPWSVIGAIGTFGLISTSILITTNVTSGQFQIIRFVALYLENNINRNESIMVVSNPIYSWIFKYVYHKDNVLNEVNDFDYEPVKTKKILFISDVESEGISPDSERLRTLYNTTNQIFKINGLSNKFNTTKYPYASMSENYESMDRTEVRVCTPKCVNYD